MDEDLKPIMDRCSEWGVLDTKVIRTSQVALASWVGMKCQYGCPNYGQRLDCPPHTPGPETMRRLLEEYGRVLLLKLKRYPYYRPEWSGLVLKVERELFLSQFHRAFAVGAGACGYCEKECVRQIGKCPKPQNIRPSAESMGVDWFQTLKNAGWGLRVVTERSEDNMPPSYSLILVD